jgi:NAD(P)-dependent dehydrogenase (short-subunit alcohol dehydrogenase family)
MAALRATCLGNSRRGARKQNHSRNPDGPPCKPEEVTGLVAYLASEVATFLTGANIAISGGKHIS